MEWKGAFTTGHMPCKCRNQHGRLTRAGPDRMIHGVGGVTAILPLLHCLRRQFGVRSTKDIGTEFDSGTRCGTL